MTHDRKVLDKHLRHWRDQGLVPPQLESALRSASDELALVSTRGVVRTALSALGGGLLLAGLILIVAENWDALHRAFKLGGWALLQSAFLLGLHHFHRRWPDRPALPRALAFVAGGWMLGGIALVSQIYQLDSRPPNGVWLWLALVLPAAWLLEQGTATAIVFVALVAGLSLEANQLDSVFCVANGEGPWMWLGIPLLAAGFVSWLPRKAPRIREATGLWTFLTANFFLLFFGAAKELDRSDLGRGWWLAGAGLLLALALPKRCLAGPGDGATSRLLLGASLLPWVVMGGQYDAGRIPDELAVGIAWIVQLGLAVLTIRSGAREGSPTWVNLGYLALLAGILTRYFDFFGDYLQGGTALALTGGLMLFIVYALEKARRSTLGKEAHA